ncbi:hypothetical protein ABZ738_20555 [Micromonospora sp. NPDC047793]|uniref:hypothetical protein n=1 Tax=Micromonospora sp. NPDC047793 TaxID=3154342 RepID=UPI0033CDC3A6
MTTDLLADVAETFERTSRVRIFDSAGPGEPHRKRRGRRSVLADQRDAEALTHLRTALALRPDTEVMDWMQWPDLWLELLGPDDGRLAVIGYLRPDWLRWKSDGDLELRDPTAFVQWLTRWAPAAATATAG